MREVRNRRAELCQASAQSTGAMAAGGGGGHSLQGPTQDTGARQSWQRRGPALARCREGGAQGQVRDWVQSPAPDGWWGSGQALLRCGALATSAASRKGWAAQTPPARAGAQSQGRILGAERCRRDLPAQAQGVPLSRATRRHRTWDLMQELVGGARQDPDPVQLRHQVGVLIQDKPALPAKGSWEESGWPQRCQGATPRSPHPHWLTTPLSVERQQGSALRRDRNPPTHSSPRPWGTRTGPQQGQCSQPRGLWWLPAPALLSRSRRGVGPPQQEGLGKGAGGADRSGFPCCTGPGWSGLGRGD